MRVSPAQLGGRGLKLFSVRADLTYQQVSPAQLGGRGLKRIGHDIAGWIGGYRPLSWAGAD